MANHFESSFWIVKDAKWVMPVSMECECVRVIVTKSEQSKHQIEPGRIIVHTKEVLQFAVVVDHEQNNIFGLIQKATDTLECILDITAQDVSLVGFKADMGRQTNEGCAGLGRELLKDWRNGVLQRSHSYMEGWVQVATTKEEQRK